LLKSLLPATKRADGTKRGTLHRKIKEMNAAQNSADQKHEWGN